MIPTFTVTRSGKLEPIYEKLDDDPRGVVWMWEPPKSNAFYVMAIDPTMGRTGWTREMRTKDDQRVDNGAIEIIRVGSPDVQVCEYAAPVDPEDLADVANVLGRVYSGREEDGCLCILEVWPGPGLATRTKMTAVHHYYNFWVWKYLDTMLPKSTGSLGWQTSAKSKSHLWIKCRRHFAQRKILINSPYFAEEMYDIQIDPVKMTFAASEGRHDDRCMALFMAIWAGHEFGSDFDLSIQPKVEENPPGPSWQASDTSVSKMLDEWDQKFTELLED